MTPLTPADPQTRSADLVAENVARLREHFPEAFTEGRIDFDVLRQLLGGAVDDREEKYGLNWHGKRRARQLALTASTGTLRPCPGDGVDEATTQNVVIEGDNLEVLKLLQKSYSGKVKLIYIDPPYNTGNDFVYPDDFTDSIGNYKRLTGQVDVEGRKLTSNPETSGRFHTDWLNMMYPRLKLARNLLAPDGAIFISIDDNELSSLRLLGDHIFGQECCAGCVARVTGTPTGGGFRALVNETDNLLIYFREPDTKIEGLTFCEDDAAIYDKQDANGKYLTRSLRRTGGEDRREDRPSMYYGIEDPEGNIVYPVAPAGYQSRWICGKERYAEMVAESLIEWQKKNRNGLAQWQVYQKFYLDGRLKQPSNLWSELEGNKKATRDLKSCFDGEKVFSFPKPVGLIRHIIGMSASQKNSLILDFFAGSGTTGHAVMAQNAADGGTRRYILVQLPEPLDPTNKDQKTAATFCDTLKKPGTIAELTKERLRRAGAKVKAENPLFAVAGDTGFRVFTLDSSNLRTWEPDAANLAKSLEEATVHVKAGRTEDDILTELLLKLGLDLCFPVETKAIAGKAVRSVGGGVLLACLAESISRADAEPLALGIAAWHTESAPAGESQVVFRDSAFADDVTKSNLAAILHQHGLTNVRSL